MLSKHGWLQTSLGPMPKSLNPKPEPRAPRLRRRNYWGTYKTAIRLQAIYIRGFGVCGLGFRRKGGLRVVINLRCTACSKRQHDSDAGSN